MMETSAFDSSAGSSGLSKSQKKRMKRNNAKARKADEQETGTKRSQDLGPLNPLDKVKAGLQTLGYSLSQIEKALEEMWDTQLPYDDVESVHNFLMMKAHVKRTVEPKVEIPKNMDTAVNPIEAEALASQPASDFVEDDIAGKVHESDAFEKKDENNQEEEEEEEDDVETTNQSQPPVTLASKLEIAANYEDLNQAISALSDWVTRSASSSEIREFCNPSKSSAFLTIVSRCLKDSGEESKGMLVDLVTSILRSSGMPISGFITVAKSLWHVINTAKSATYAPLTDGILNTIPLELSSHVSTTLDLLSSSRKETEKTIQLLQSDISEKQSSCNRPSSANVAVELMLKRDRSQEIVKTSSSIVTITNGYILSSFTNGQENTIDRSDSNTDICSLVESLLGDKYKMARSFRVKIDELRRKCVESNSTIMSDKDSLQSELHSKRLRQKVIQDRIHALQAELRNLTEEDTLLTQSIEKTAVDLERLDLSVSSEVRQMEKDIESMSKILVLEDLATEFSQCTMDLRTVFRDIATQSARGKVEKEGAKVEDDFQAASNRFHSYASHVKTYFESELSLIEFLTNRYVGLEINIPILGKQIEECSMLGMKTNVAEMTKEYTHSMARIAEDKQAISSLKAEAESMKTEFIKLLEKFVLVCLKAAVETSTIVTLNKSLSSIRSMCIALELPLDEKTQALFDRFSPEESAPITVTNPKSENVPDFTNGHANSNGKSVENGTSNVVHGDLPESESSRSVTAVKTVPKPAAVAPLTKRGWGSIATQSTKQPAQSLIDIQKEQRKSA